MNRLRIAGRVLDRRGLLAACGLVALGATSASAALKSVDDDSRKLSPTARMAVPADSSLPYQVRFDIDGILAAAYAQADKDVRPVSFIEPVVELGDHPRTDGGTELPERSRLFRYADCE